MDLNALTRALSEAVKTSTLPEVANPVDPTALRRFWEFTQELQTRYPASPEGGCVGIDIRVLEAEFPGLEFPDTDPLALWLRAGFVSLLQKTGALGESDSSEPLNDVFFQVAATFPFGTGEVNTALFREELAKARAANT